MGIFDIWVLWHLEYLVVAVGIWNQEKYLMLLWLKDNWCFNEKNTSLQLFFDFGAAYMNLQCWYLNGNDGQ